jgi:hypothetical protein
LQVRRFAASRKTMRVKFRSLLVPAALLAVATASFAQWSQEAMPDPVAPAVLGRPLDRIHPSHHAHEKSAVAHARARHVEARTAAGSKVARLHAPSLRAGPALHASSTMAMGAAGQRPAKQALDDRADPRVRTDDVGRGTHFARKELGPGVYFGDRPRAAVRRYYEEHPLAVGPSRWKIGEPVPAGAALQPVPTAVAASLPRLPPGHRYVEIDGEVVMIAAGSKMVVDGISRTQ